MRLGKMLAVAVAAAALVMPAAASASTSAGAHARHEPVLSGSANQPCSGCFAYYIHNNMGWNIHADLYVKDVGSPPDPAPGVAYGPLTIPSNSTVKVPSLGWSELTILQAGNSGRVLLRINGITGKSSN